MIVPSVIFSQTRKHSRTRLKTLSSRFTLIMQMRRQKYQIIRRTDE